MTLAAFVAMLSFTLVTGLTGTANATERDGNIPGAQKTAGGFWLIGPFNELRGCQNYAYQWSRVDINLNIMPPSYRDNQVMTPCSRGSNAELVFGADPQHYYYLGNIAWSPATPYFP